jgi:hypothetical protein
MRCFEGEKKKGAPRLNCKETQMKTIIQTVVVAALFTGTQAFATENTVSAFPRSVDDAGISVSSASTSADRHAAQTAKGAMVSAFPSSVDDAGISVSSKSIYADRWVNEQAGGANNPTLIR